MTARAVDFNPESKQELVSNPQVVFSIQIPILTISSNNQIRHHLLPIPQPHRRSIRIIRLHGTTQMNSHAQLHGLIMQRFVQMSPMDHTIRHAEILFKVRLVRRIGDDFAILPSFPPEVFGLDGLGFDGVFHAPFVQDGERVGWDLDACAELLLHYV